MTRRPAGGGRRATALGVALDRRRTAFCLPLVSLAADAVWGVLLDRATRGAFAAS